MIPAGSDGMRMKSSFCVAVFLVSVLLAGVSCAPVPEADPPIRLDDRVQLFVDDFLVERMDRVWRSLGRGGKVAGNPLIRSDRPWEGYLILQPGSVIYSPEKQIFEMWYNTLPRTGETDIDQFVCYATSEDGIRWEKPELNHLEFRGSKANNIVLRWNNWNHSVILDPEDPDPARRYKMGYWQTRDRDRCGIWAAFSPDGIRWTDYEKNPVVPCWATGDTFAVMRDPVSRQYWLYHKTNPGGPRKVSRLVSDDFIHWTDDRLVLEPDAHDRPGTEFYGLSAFPHGSQTLGLLWVFHTNIQTMDVQLVSSRDGVKWDRSVYRRPLIYLGYQRNEYSGKSFDSGMIWPITAPVIKDGMVWIYYSGFDNLHNAPSEDHTGEIGLARLRQDGFVALDATAEGSVLTRPVQFSGSTLQVNARLLRREGDASEAPGEVTFNDSPNQEGYLKIEVQDVAGNPIPGYEADASGLAPVEGVYSKVSWKGKDGLQELQDRPVRLKFILSRTRLYSFQIN